MEGHFTEIFELNANGWWEAECHCGWASGETPSADIAADSFGDHCFAEGLMKGPTA